MAEEHQLPVDQETRPPDPPGSPIVSIGADVDVRALVGQIQSEVARKVEAGLYPPELLMDIEAGNDPLGAALLALRDAAQFSRAAPTASGRARFSGVVSALKRVIAKALGWHTRWILDQVHTFGSNVVATSSATAELLREHDRALNRLRGQMTRLQSQVPVLDGAAPSAPDRPDTSAGSGENRSATLTGGGRSRQVERELDYLTFENRFRGSLEEISGRQSAYLELFRIAPGKVVDLGCGRGEFLGLLKTIGVPGYGVDMSEVMVASCRQRGLDVRREDLLDHLASVPEGSLGGIFCAQVLEHLDPADVIRFFDLAWVALADGGVLVVETLNPRSLATFTNALYVDLGHLRPLHPYTLTFLAEGAGFVDVHVRYSSPVPPEGRLKKLPATEDAALQPLVTLLNENLHQIDELLYGPQDFAVVARR
jgi:SAM-dependent methyltransferase